MNWDLIGGISELLATTAVIVSLIYLALQVRANTTATQTASRYELARDYRQIFSLHLDRDVANAIREGVWSYPNMPYEDRILFSTYISNESLFFQGVFAQYEAGQLEQETYEAYLCWFASLIVTPGGSAWWEDSARPILLPRMVAVVDQRVAGGDLSTEVWENGQFGRNNDKA